LCLAGLIGVCRQCVSEIETERVMLHESTWDAFCRLEAKHNQRRAIFPERWT
jgi:hypothetical protein